MESENRFGQALNRVGDIIWLNILWLVCCLPVVTIGAATTAAYHAAFSWDPRNTTATTHDFFTSFRANWKQATVVWLILLGMLFVSSALVGTGMMTTGFLSELAYAAGSLGLMLAVFFFLMVFPILAQFDLSVGQVFQNALYLLLRRTWPVLVVVLTAVVSAVVVFKFAPPIFAMWGGLVIYLNSCVLRPEFARITGADSGASDKTEEVPAENP